MPKRSTNRLRVAVTPDLRSWGDIGVARLDGLPELVEWAYLPDGKAWDKATLAGVEALILNAPEVTSALLDDAQQLGLIARFGVGYDNVDIAACTRRGVIVTNTPDAVRTPVAHAAVCLVLGLAHQLLAKDRITREGNWAARMDLMGRALDHSTVGLVGLGNIGTEVARLLSPFGPRLMAFDPYAQADDPRLANVSVSLTDLPSLLGQSDFVVVLCPLTEDTRALLGSRELSLMDTGAYLINLSRGEVVDQQALTHALQDGCIAGAALDVFNREPLPVDDPILQLDNVIVTPHSLSWTDGMREACGRSAIDSVLAYARGTRPVHVVNAAALAHERNRYLSS